MEGPFTPLARAVLAFSLASLFILPLSSGRGSCGDDGTTWTVMAYMAADTDPSLPWLEDINEMEAATIPDWMNIVALVDPYGTGDSFMLEICQDVGYNDVVVSTVIDDGDQVVPAYGEADMSSWETLRDFTVYSATNYPADRLVLVLWGHGGGWHGLCQDRLSVMSLPDLAKALGSATDLLDRRLDMVVVDACAEGVLETMYEIRGFADFYVGSERNVPLFGLRYDLALDSLSRDRDLAPNDWGAYICETYRMSLYFQSVSATMAVYDLSAVGEFADRLVEYGQSSRGYVRLYAEETMGMLLGTTSTDYSEWYLDIGDMLRRSVATGLPLETRHCAFEALKAYDAVVYRFETYASPFDADYPSVVNSTGASVYVPSPDPADSTYWSVSLADTGWADACAAVRSATESEPNGPAPDVRYEDTDGDGALDAAVMQSAPGHDRYEAWVFSQTASGMQLASRLESPGPNITLAGLAGEFLVSASAWDGDEARSHHTLNIALAGTVEVNAKVILRGEPTTEGLRVQVVTGYGTVELQRTEDGFVGRLTVTSEVDYGELVTVEVRDRRGELLACNRTFIQGSEVSLQIALSGERAEGLGPEFIIPAAALAVSAMAAAVLIINRGRERVRK